MLWIFYHAIKDLLRRATTGRSTDCLYIWTQVIDVNISEYWVIRRRIFYFSTMYMACRIRTNAISSTPGRTHLKRCSTGVDSGPQWKEITSHIKFAPTRMLWTDELKNLIRRVTCPHYHIAASLLRCDKFVVHRPPKRTKTDQRDWWKLFSDVSLANSFLLYHRTHLPNKIRAERPTENMQCPWKQGKSIIFCIAIVSNLVRELFSGLSFPQTATWKDFAESVRIRPKKSCGCLETF